MAVHLIEGKQLLKEKGLDKFGKKKGGGTTVARDVTPVVSQGVCAQNHRFLPRPKESPKLKIDHKQGVPPLKSDEKGC